MKMHIQLLPAEIATKLSAVCANVLKEQLQFSVNMLLFQVSLCVPDLFPAFKT